MRRRLFNLAAAGSMILLVLFMGLTTISWFTGQGLHKERMWVELEPFTLTAFEKVELYSERGRLWLQWMYPLPEGMSGQLSDRGWKKVSGTRTGGLFSRRWPPFRWRRLPAIGPFGGGMTVVAESWLVMLVLSILPAWWYWLWVRRRREGAAGFPVTVMSSSPLGESGFIQQRDG